MREQRSIGAWLFFLFVVVVLLWLILIPLGQMIVSSFRTGHPVAPGPFTLKNYLVAYINPLTYRMIFNTMLFAGAGTAITVSIAVLFAWLIERTDMPLRNLCWSLLLIPMAMPGLLFSIAYVFLLSPRSGIVNVFLRALFSEIGIELAEGPINIYSLGGMIFLDGIRGVTTVFLLIVGAFRMMDPALEEASWAAGARNWMTLRRVTLPVLWPALLAAIIYEFSSSMESFEAPLVVGLPGSVYVYSTMIYISTREPLPNYGLGATFAVSYIMMAVAFAYFYQRAILRQSERFTTVTGKGYRPRIMALGRWRYPALAMFFGYFFVAVALPISVLIWTSLLPNYQPPSMEALAQTSWNNYRLVFNEPQVLRTAWNTVVVTVITATATVALAFSVSWLVVRTKLRGRFALDGLTFASHAVPGVVIALSFILLYLQPPFRYLGLYGTVWIISLALITQYVAFASRSTHAAITQIHRELEEAGEVSGAGRLRVIWQITYPLIRPAFVAAWIWVAAHAVRSFSIPLLLASRENRTLAVMLWHYWDEEANQPAAAALGVLLILFLTLFTFSGRVLISRGFSQK
ncbi:MAG TPA: iron ABC transporter permease [Candidatus Limnocylindrales bacterium]|nr:iron ABC transporter permease [Candidatus Limnocylindrales bacterium]